MATGSHFWGIAREPDHNEIALVGFSVHFGACPMCGGKGQLQEPWIELDQETEDPGIDPCRCPYAPGCGTPAYRLIDMVASVDAPRDLDLALELISECPGVVTIDAPLSFANPAPLGNRRRRPVDHWASGYLEQAARDRGQDAKNGLVYLHMPQFERPDLLDAYGDSSQRNLVDLAHKLAPTCIVLESNPRLSYLRLGCSHDLVQGYRIRPHVDDVLGGLAQSFYGAVAPPDVRTGVACLCGSHHSTSGFPIVLDHVNILPGGGRHLTPGLLDAHACALTGWLAFAPGSFPVRADRVDWPGAGEDWPDATYSEATAIEDRSCVDAMAQHVPFYVLGPHEQPRSG